METVALIEKVLAGAIVFACVALLVRQFIGAPRRYRLDSAVRRAISGARAVAIRLRDAPAARRAARAEAEQAIRRARGDRVERDGNVYRPKSLRKPRKLH